MRAEIISIGTEILLGHITNTNATYLSRKLAELGIDVYYHTTVGDNPARLSSAISYALGRSDIVITTGGLGPTVDDYTLQALSMALDKKLTFKKEIWRLIQNRFRIRHIKTPKNNIRQAYIPSGVIWVKNDRGTAPGIISKWGHPTNKADRKSPGRVSPLSVLIALPGPPMELMPMFEESVVPYLKKLTYKKSSIIKTRTIKTTGSAESQLHPKVKKILEMSGSATVGIYAKPGQVDLKITAKAHSEKDADKLITTVEHKIRKKLKNLIFGIDEQTLEGSVAGLLSKNNKTIAIAESCTGGLLSSRLTDIPGASRYLKFSLVAYSYFSKTLLLGVPPQIIKKYGAVSRQTVLRMAANARKLANTDMGVAITGIAGPGGATKKKPVGLVYIALSTKNKIICKECHFTGERKVIKFLSSQVALNMLREQLSIAEP